MEKIRVLLADDHAVLRAGLRLLIDKQPDMEVVGEAAACLDAIAKLRDTETDVILLDISMPGMSATEAIQRILHERPGIKVLVLTMHDDPALAHAVMEAGAAGYVVKTATHDELMSAIQAVHGGRTFVDVALGPKMSAELMERAADGPAPRAGARRTAISPREREVLTFLARGLTNREIAERLQVGVKTVETYRLRLGQKLGLKRRQDFVRYGLETGMLDRRHHPDTDEPLGPESAAML